MFALLGALTMGLAQGEEPHRPRSFAIQGATLVPVSGPVLENATIVLKDGLIEAIGPDIQVLPDAWVVEGKGLTVYPGLIDALSSVGLPGGGAESEGRPEPQVSRGPQDRPATTPWRLAADLFDPSQERVQQWRSAGFTSAVVAPTDGIFAGQAAVVNLAGERSGEMVVDPHAALVVNLEDFRSSYRGFPASLMGRIAYVKQVFLDAAQYRQAWAVYHQDPSGLQRPAYDRALDPIRQAMDDHRPVLYPGNLAKQILRGIDVSTESGFPVVVYGCQEGYRAAGALAAHKVAALVDLKWPEKPKDPDPEDEEALRLLRLRDQAPTTPAEFAKAGVQFAFSSGGLQKGSDLLPKVRVAIGKGLSKDAALRALTLSAAEIYGVADRLGSLQAGKIANLVVTEGELFDEAPKLKMVFVDGRKYDIPTPEKETAGDEKKAAEGEAR